MIMINKPATPTFFWFSQRSFCVLSSRKSMVLSGSQAQKEVFFKGEATQKASRQDLEESFHARSRSPACLSASMRVMHCTGQQLRPARPGRSAEDLPPTPAPETLANSGRSPTKISKEGIERNRILTHPGSGRNEPFCLVGPAGFPHCEMPMPGRAQRAVTDVLTKPDAALEMTLRPSLFSDFTGQAKVKERLEITVAAAKQRNEAIDHILLSGPPGLGKTTLANIIAKAMGANMKSTSGPTIEKAGDLAGLLTNLEEGDVLFIDEIHRLQKTIEEYLYPAMEDFKLDIIIDQGPNARSVRLNLPRFTLIGATTRSGLLTAPLLTRFPVRERLDYYQAEQLEHIVVRSARLLNIEIDPSGAKEIARRSRGTPRIANNLLRR